MVCNGGYLLTLILSQHAVSLLLSAQGPGSSEQTRAPEGSGEEEEGASSKGSEGGAGGPQEEERPGDRAYEETTEARAGNVPSREGTLNGTFPTSI